MKNILTFFMIHHMLLAEPVAKANYHLFVSACFFLLEPHGDGRQPDHGLRLEPQRVPRADAVPLFLAGLIFVAALAFAWLASRYVVVDYFH